MTTFNFLSYGKSTTRIPKNKINTRNQKETQEKLEETDLQAGLMGI
jgi:hypothetical protein